jgi:hypothetical protein
MTWMLPRHSITACSPVGTGRRGISIQRPGFCAAGATLVM